MAHADPVHGTSFDGPHNRAWTAREFVYAGSSCGAIRLGFAGVVEMARVGTDPVVGHIALISLLVIVDECCLLFRTLVPHPNRFGSLDRPHVRTDTTDTRTATHPGGRG